MNPLRHEVERLHTALAELLKVSRIYGNTWIPRWNPSWKIYLDRAEAALDGCESGQRRGFRVFGDYLCESVDACTCGVGTSERPHRTQCAWIPVAHMDDILVYEVGFENW